MHGNNTTEIKLESLEVLSKSILTLMLFYL